MDIARKTIPEIKKIIDAASEGRQVELFSQLLDDPRAGVRKLLKAYRSEKARLEATKNAYEELTRFERKLYSQGFKMIAGVDEAGRGALAGPIVAAAVILPEQSQLYGIKDSKLLSPEKREILYEKIINTAIAWNVVRIEHYDIDANGIQWANLRSLEMAALGLNPAADYILSDGFDIKTLTIPHLAITKGDNLSVSIAAASIIAKVTRDRIMQAYHAEYPQYGFDQHKGYGTLLHKKAIEKYGPAPIHRKYFAPVAEYEQLSF
ncbi:MAG: ribonuclease HII [Firmicutes bacterium]|nr:ribonuclease HII [Bacillota bacterium]